MAASSPAMPDRKPQPSMRTIKPAQRLPPSPEPGPLEPQEAQQEASGLAKTVRTLLALGGAVALAIVTVLLVPEASTFSGGEQVLLTVIVGVVAFLGLLPMRWGWWVMAGVAAAFFGLNLYNLFNPGGTVFVHYRGSSYTFAAMLPAVGVVVGGACQALYRFVGGK